MRVNRDATSKDTKVSLSCTDSAPTKVTNWDELMTVEAEVPTTGDNSVHRCFDNLYVGDETNDTIGVSGTPSLCGIRPAELRNREYKLLDSFDALLSWNNFYSFYALVIMWGLCSTVYMLYCHSTCS